jgi:hypothetical protein
LKRGESRTGLAENSQGSPNTDDVIGNNGEKRNHVTGGISSRNGAEGRTIVRSVLDIRDTNGETNKHENKYQFSMKIQNLGVSGSLGCGYYSQGNFKFGQSLGTSQQGQDGCGWRSYTPNRDIIFSGNDSLYYDQNVEYSKQTYQFLSQNVLGQENYQWNLTNSYNSESIWNRALGKTIDGNFTVANQSSNSIVATDINSSNLLGLQSLNATDNKNDSNTYRPQLQTSYRRTGDAFNGAIPDDSTTNNINGARARTGQTRSVGIQTLRLI